MCIRDRLKAACKCAVQEQQRQQTLTVWLAGNARATESAAVLSDSDPAHSGAGVILEAVRQALPVARKRIVAKRRQECAILVFKAKNGGRIVPLLGLSLKQNGGKNVPLRRLKQITAQ